MWYVVTILIFRLSIASITYFLPINEENIDMDGPAIPGEEPLERLGVLEEETLLNKDILNSCFGCSGSKIYYYIKRAFVFLSSGHI